MFNGVVAIKSIKSPNDVWIPNITGQTTGRMVWQSDPDGSGCFSASDEMEAKLQTGPYCTHAKLMFNASDSSALYSSSKLQPNALQALVCIKF